MFNTSLNNPSKFMPDYSAAISATGAYDSSDKFTAPADGVLIYICWSQQNKTKLYVNDQVVGGMFGSTGGWGISYPLILPMRKGETFYQEYASATQANVPNEYSMFVPFKWGL